MSTPPYGGQHPQQVNVINKADILHYKEIVSQKLKLKYSLNRDSYIKVIDSIIENNITVQLDINSYSTQNSEISKKQKILLKAFMI